MDVAKFTNFCHVCSSELQYSYKYDAYYCELCNTWLEEPCDSVDCEFCANRPSKPSQITN